MSRTKRNKVTRNKKWKRWFGGGFWWFSRASKYCPSDVVRRRIKVKDDEGTA